MEKGLDLKPRSKPYMSPRSRLNDREQIDAAGCSALLQLGEMSVSRILRMAAGLTGKSANSNGICALRPR